MQDESTIARVAAAQTLSLPSVKADSTTASISNSIFRSSAKPANTFKPQLGASLLSKLPGELRNRIWRLVVVQDVDIPVNVARYSNKDGEQCGCIQIQHALMHVSKQARYEVTEIYYLENTFRIFEEVMHARPIEALVKTLKPWGQNVTRLEVSHELERHAECETRKMSAMIGANLTVCRVEGRIVVIPPTGNITAVIQRRESGNEMHTEVREVMAQGLCCCKIASLVNNHATDSVLEWTQKYVKLVNKAAEGNARKSYGYMAYCWDCAGMTMLGPINGTDELSSD